MEKKPLLNDFNHTKTQNKRRGRNIISSSTGLSHIPLSLDGFKKGRDTAHTD